MPGRVEPGAAVRDPESHLARVQQQFRRQADAYERLAAVADAEGLGRLAALAGLTNADTVVDVACGPGFLTMALGARCGRAVGIDATDVFLAHARAEASRRGLQRTTFVLGDVGALPLASSSVDVATCRAAFHHFPVPAAVLAEMVRVTRPGGRLLVADIVSSEDPARADRHNRIERLCDPTHVRALRESEFDALFAARGLRAIFRGHAIIDYALEDWIAHGGPSVDDAREIRRLMEASIDGDTTGLGVRRDGAALRFSHRAVAVLLERPSAAA